MPTPWFDATAAKKRLSQLDGELQKLQGERALIQQILGLTDGGQAPRSASPTAPAPRRGRPPSKTSKGRHRPGAPTLVELIIDALRSASPAGITVAEIIDHIGKDRPDRVGAPNVSALISSAIAQARKAKKQKIKVVMQGGPGVPSRYGPA